MLQELKAEAKTASTNLTWLYLYFHNSIQIQIHLFCTRWFFASEIVFECFVPNIQLLLKRPTY